MSRSIVCGVDDSPDAQAALHVAARLAIRLGLRLVVAHIAEPVYLPYAAAAFGGTAGRFAVMEEAESQEESAARLLEAVVGAAGLVDPDRRAGVGLAAECLAELADEEVAELIVVGSRGRGALKSAFLGGVSSSLVGVARCPLPIVPPGATEAS